MLSDHTYSSQCMATAGQADDGFFNSQPSGCPVQQLLAGVDTVQNAGQCAIKLITVFSYVAIAD